ncbi:hypothetical protein J6590_072784 [Homalodisca vitripennis]|nr:hypothetical protein J6590_072784 [Homalodisca vitripennis]
MKADPESSLRGTKPEDHNILCNLANLYKDLLRAMDGEQLTRWLPELITTIINHSVQLPLVSGFYKLLAAVLGVADRTNYFQAPEFMLHEVIMSTNWKPGMDTPTTDVAESVNSRTIPTICRL